MLRALQRRTGRFSGRLRTQRQPVYRLLPGGAGQSRCITLASEFKGLFASEFIGSWYVMAGDGSMVTGSTGTFAPSVTPPTSVTSSFISSGANGTAGTARRYPASTSVNDTGGTQAPAGDFSFVALVKINTVTGVRQHLGGQSGAINTNTSGFLDLGTSAIPALFVFNAGGSSSSAVLGFAVTTRAWTLLVGTYTRTGGAADNILKIYLNGSAGAVTTSNGVLANAASTAAHRVGLRGSSAEPLSGDVAFFGFTEKALTAAMVDDMALATLGSLGGSFGETITHTRNSIATAVNEAGFVGSVYANRPRVFRGGILTEPAATNLAVRSEEFDNASWTKTDTTITANATTSPDGTATADLATEGVAGTASLLQNYTGTANITQSVSRFYKRGNHDWVRLTLYNSASGANLCAAWFNLATGAVGSVVNEGDGAGAAATIEALADGWYRCTLSGIPDDGVTTYGSFCYSASADASTTRVNSAERYVWGSQFEQQGRPTTYLRTEASTVTRSATVFTTPTAVWPTTAGELRCRIMLPRGNNTLAVANVLSTATGNSGLQILINADTTLTVSTGNGTAFTATSSAALTWTAGQWYALRVRWSGGVVTAWRDDVEVLTGTSKNMPDQHVAAGFLGSNASSALQLNGFLADLEVFR